MSDSTAGAVPGVDLSPYAAAVPDEVIERLRGARRVLTICHENPEADALGSALAHALLVEAGGGVATPVCADAMPEMYKFMRGMDRFRQEPDPSIDYDLIVVGDCGELERIGPVLETASRAVRARPHPGHRPSPLESEVRSGGLDRRAELGHVRDDDAPGLAHGRAPHHG